MFLSLLLQSEKINVIYVSAAIFWKQRLPIRLCKNQRILIKREKATAVTYYMLAYIPPCDVCL